MKQGHTRALEIGPYAGPVKQDHTPALEWFGTGDEHNVLADHNGKHREVILLGRDRVEQWHGARTTLQGKA